MPELLQPCGRELLQPCGHELLQPCDHELLLPCGVELLQPCGHDLLLPCGLQLVEDMTLCTIVQRGRYGIYSWTPTDDADADTDADMVAYINNVISSSSKRLSLYLVFFLVVFDNAYVLTLNTISNPWCWAGPIGAPCHAMGGSWLGIRY